MSAIAGRVLLIPKGNYDSTATYTMLDMVVYNGSSYICKQECTGVVPTNTTYWMLNASGSAVAYINDIGDVVITNPTNGQVLMYDSTTQNWVNGTITTTLAGLTDTQIASLSNGQVLKYNATSQKWENAEDTGGLLPHLIIISETGESVVKAVKGTTEIIATETSTGHYECDVPEFGTWTIHAVLNGDDAIVNLVVDTVKVYTVDDSHFHADITVKYPSGATCNLAGQGESYYATGSPYTFTVHHAGQYTITVVYDGQTYTETVTVTTTGEIVSKVVPSPSSAPANDIDFWLFFGDVSGSYSSLSDILADSTALATLMASTDAVDYLVRCTDWASNEGLVPVMTSDTAPSGTCSTNSKATSDRYAYLAFSTDSNSWLPAVGVSPSYLQYDFGSGNGKVVQKVSLRLTSSYSFTIPIEVSGSNDGTTFTSLTTDSISVNNETKDAEVLFENTTSYRYYRITFNTQLYVYGTGNACNVRLVQFYHIKQAVTENQNAMSYIGLNNYCANTLLADEDWLEGIANSEYVDSVLNVKVPTMTSNTTPSGEVIAYGSVSGSTPAYYAFNGDSSRDCANENAIGNGLGYNFGKNVSVKMAYVKPNHADTFKLQVSSDGTTWVDVATVVGDTTNGSYAIGVNSNSFPYARIIQTTKISTDSWQRYVTIQFYGREDV